MNRREQPARAIAWALAIVAAGASATALTAALGHALLSDDWGLFRNLGADGIAADFTRTWLGQSAVYYRPLATVALTLDWLAFGTMPLGYHITALVWWCAVAAAAAAYAHRLADGAPLAAPIAFGLCWLNPIIVEPVGWICCRTVLMAALFALLSALAAGRFARSGGVGIAAVAALAHVAALLSKEDGLLVPALSLVLAARAGLGRRFWTLVALHGVVTIAYVLWRSAIDAPLIAGEHAARLAPGAWGGSAATLIELAALATAPRVDATWPAFVVGAAMLALLAARPGWTRTVAVVALVLGCLPATLHAQIDVVHGSRLLTFAAVAVAIGIATWAAVSPRVGRFAVAAIAVAWVAVGLPVLDRWRAAGDEARDVAEALTALHDRVPPDEPILFVDSPRFRDGVPVLDQTIDAILSPPFVDRPRALAAVFDALAGRIAREEDRRPMRHVEWHDGTLYDAPLPRTSMPLPTWRGSRSPRIGVSRLAMSGLLVETTPIVTTLTFTVDVTGPVATTLTIRSTADATGRHDLRFGTALHTAGVVRIDRLSVRAAGVTVDAVVPVRAPPTIELRGGIRQIEDDVELSLETDLHWPVETDRISVRIHALRSLVTRIDRPAATFVRDEAGRHYRIRVPLSKLREGGIRPGTHLYITVTGHADGDRTTLWDTSAIAIRLP